MILAKQHGMGFIPDWQFSSDPKVNIKLNPHALSGFGAIRRPSMNNRGCCDGGNIPDDCCSGFTMTRGLRDPLDLFTSPVWTHRKWLVLGGVALLGLAFLGGAGALLR